MATKNLTLYSAYRIGSGEWLPKGGWTAPLTNSNNNGDENRFYLGGEKKYRARLKITIDSSLVISSTNSLILKLTGDEPTHPKYMRAYLSTENHSNAVSDSTIMSKSLEMSYLWLDTSKTKRATASQSTPVPMYAIFNYQVKAGTTYYVYLLPFASDAATSPTYNGTWLRARNRAADCSVVLNYESYSAVGPVTNQKISSTSIYKNGSVTLSWAAAANGINNNVNKYRIFYQVGSYPSLTTPTYLETTSTSITIKNSDIGNFSKGTTVYFSIQTIGSVSGYNSALVKVSYYQVKNQAPGWPSFSVQGVISSQKESTLVKVVDISTSDIDNDNLTYYYKVTDQPTAPDITGAERITNNQFVEVTPTRRYIYMWAYDGTAYGSSSRKTVEVNTAPIINSVTISGEDILNNAGLSCTRTIDASAILSKEVASYEWSIWNAGALVFFPIGTTATLTDVIISQYIHQPGERIIVKLKVTDAAGDSASVEYQTNLYQMPDIRGPEAIFVSRNEPVKGSVAAKYVNTKVAATITIPEPAEIDIPLKKIDIKAISNDVEYLVYSGVPSSGENIITFAHNFAYGRSYIFRAEITDNADRISSITSANSVERLPLISLSAGSGIFNSVSPEEWHVLQNQEFILNTFYPDSSAIGMTTYTIYGSINDGVYRELDTFDSNSVKATIIGQTITYRNQDSFELFKKLKVSTNTDAYKINYRIVAQNAFGVSGDSSYYGLISNKTVITKEPPIFSEEAYFFARVGFTRDRAMSWVTYNDTPNINTSESERMFNAGEVLDFGLSELALDLNSKHFDGTKEEQLKTIKSYKIEYALAQQVIPQPSTLSQWTILGELSPEAWVLSPGEGFYHQGLIAPNLGDVKSYIYFRIQAIDNTKLTSNYLYFNQPLICCRKTTPQATISKISINEVGGALQANVSIRIEDYGGNNRGYENFFRQQKEETKIVVLYGSSFDSMDKRFVKTTKTNAIEQDFAFVLDPLNNGKIYFQLSLVIDTNVIGGEYNQIFYTLPIYVFYSEGPTVSHRPHWVGINNTIFEPDEVVRVEAFRKGATERHILRLIGFDSQNDVEAAIELDLNSRLITGLVINGGTWDDVPSENGYDVLTSSEGKILYASEDKILYTLEE